jgi:hypothetical protein
MAAESVIRKLLYDFQAKNGHIKPPLLYNQPRWSLNIKDSGCDNALPDQGYRSSQVMLVDVYGAMVEWRLTGKPE